MMSLDRVDREIIRELRQNARISNADLATKVGMSPSACHRRFRRLEDQGIIRGYTVLIGNQPESEGLVFVTQITLDRQTGDFLKQFEAAVRRCPEVRDCYLMTGLADYLLKLEVKDSADYERLHNEVLSQLPGVARIQSSLAIRTVVAPKTSNL